VTPERFDAMAVLNRLRAFQRDTVEHVTQRFYGHDHTSRFLVADETGLGKSLVARGVIARTIEQLQDDDRIERVDVVYVCSNADIASQNIRRLDVTGDPHLPFASRLTLLAKHSPQLAAGNRRFIKPINLVSFTPGTSFDMGWQTGQSEERAMLYLLLRQQFHLTGRQATAARRLLQGQVTTLERFTNTVIRLEAGLTDGIDPQIADSFNGRTVKLQEQFAGLIDEIGQRHRIPAELRDSLRSLIGELRAELAAASVHTLEPDLIILDEFQRFRHLLDDTTEAGELAHHLFNYPDARVLLLSATPYKPFTYAEEAAEGDDHQHDFLRTVRFLTDGCASASPDIIATQLAAYRTAAVTGAPVTGLANELRHELLKVMCRSERPEAAGGSMHVECRADARPSEADLLGYVALRRVAAHVEGQMTMEYWKSAPYFINFMDGYQLAAKVRDSLSDPRRADGLPKLLANTQRVNPRAIQHFEPIDLGNARLRQLASETVEAGWWKLLWIPPSLPYLRPDGPYAEPFARTVTKRLVFSSWAATPTSVAALLSYEADRLNAEGTRLTENSPTARRAVGSRLAYDMDGGRPGAMTTLALFWPTPGLAALADPLRHARGTTEAPVAADVEAAVAAEVASRLPAGSTSRASTADAWYWAAAITGPDALPASPSGTDLRAKILAGLTGSAVESPDRDETPDDPAGLAAHVELALGTEASRSALGDPPPDLAETLATLALHSPANIAWRAIGRIIGNNSQITDLGRWVAAAILAGGLRSLFSRPDTTILLDRLLPDSVYWRAVLRYCAWGNLQATLDEYLHHLAVADGADILDDQRLAELATAAAATISLRPARYEAFNPTEPERRIALSARFALRYGGRKQNEESSRQPEIRAAFNSPFWPFVLASTSVGQEGVDFHWWSHAVMHWNTPANPVDFEQREGRIDRYGGHAIRRNIANGNRGAILDSDNADPWQAAYEAASIDSAELGEFAPYWVYPGPSRIERHVALYPLSSDAPKLQRLKDDAALYRLTFGQPRQEDMLELLRRRGVQDRPGLIESLRLDLSPPRRQAEESDSG
jgi:hypothetical protein